MKKLIILFSAILLSTASFAQDKKPAVTIYNPKANAQADIDAAVKKAKQEKKHVFIQIGGNWCVWCIRFHDLVNATPDLKSYLNSNYETVLVNWSPENKNEAVLKKLGYPGRFGFPVFLILDGDGKLIHTQNSAYLEEGGGHSVKKVTDFLKNWNYGALLPENNKN
ncbi:MAG: thioredoxin family protein [Pedobacter sp.]|nr:MAG: thioredoxin family protein [Pedobacter sp.]